MHATCYDLNKQPSTYRPYSASATDSKYAVNACSQWPNAVNGSTALQLVTYRRYCTSATDPEHPVDGSTADFFGPVGERERERRF